MSEPMFRRTGAQDFPMHLKMMISGPPKSGKTTLLGTVPNIIIADTEPHANNLQSIAHLDIPYKTITSVQQLFQLHMVLKDDALRAQAAQALGMPSIDAVAIDTLDTLQSIMKRERLRENGGKFLRDDWGWIKEEMAKLIEAFTSLPMHVFFTVHLKTKELGKDEDAYQVVLPGLEGGIADAIAGMVGYSVLSFRREQVQPDGTKRTQYFLRTEGDNTYEFLGTRTAGRLPYEIAPDFQTILNAAKGGRPQQQTRDITAEQIRAAVGAPPQQQAQQQQPQQQAPVQTPVQTPPAQQAPQQEQPQQAAQPEQPEQPQQPEPQQQPEQAPPAPVQQVQAEEKVNSAALMHVKKVFDAVSLPFPEEQVKELTMVQARSLVRAWQGAQKDQAEGKIPDAREEILGYLAGLGLAPDNTPPASTEEAVANVQDAMPGAEVESTTDDKCADCGGPIDDPDIARLAESRFGRRLDVTHYIAAGRN